MLQQTICVNRIKTAVQPHWDKPKELDFDCTITDSTVARAVAYRAGGGMVPGRKAWRGRRPSL